MSPAGGDAPHGRKPAGGAISSLDLARLCGVSQGTVDRALHDRPGVSPATRQRVLDAAKARGYRPHPATMELLSGKSSTITAILPALNNVFFMDVFTALASKLSAKGLGIQIVPVRDRDEFLAALEDAAARRHRMAVAIPPEEKIEIPAALEAGIRIVSLLSPCVGATFLAIDEKRTGESAINHLVGLGHLRIVHITYARKSRAITDRAEGYSRAMRKRGLAPEIISDPSPDAVARAVRDGNATALFCHNDWLAIRTLLALSDAGIRVPDDVSVMGVDGSPTMEALHPELTTLAYPISELADAVTAAIEGGKTNLGGARCVLRERATTAHRRPG